MSPEAERLCPHQNICQVVFPVVGPVFVSLSVDRQSVVVVF